MEDENVEESSQSCRHMTYVGNSPEVIRIKCSLLVTNTKKVNCGINSCAFYLKNGEDKRYFSRLEENGDDAELLNIPGKTARIADFSGILRPVDEKMLGNAEIIFEYRVNGSEKNYECEICRL